MLAQFREKGEWRREKLGEYMFTAILQYFRDDVGTMNKLTTSPERQGYRDFDLPAEHLLEGYHFVPAKAHDPAEIERRRELSRGTLITETQAKGLMVAKTVLENIDDEDGLMFAADTLAIAGVNTAWYSYAQNSDVMRRRLKLPIMAHPRLRSPDAIVEDAVEALGKQINRAGQLAVATDLRLRSEGRHQKELGVGVGNLSLRLAMLEPVVAGAFYDVGESEELAQEIARTQCLRLLKKAKNMYRNVKTHPSIAQLSDPYSDLAVYWHRNAPGSIQTAVADALSAKLDELI